MVLVLLAHFVLLVYLAHLININVVIRIVVTMMHIIIRIVIMPESLTVGSLTGISLGMSWQTAETLFQQLLL